MSCSIDVNILIDAFDSNKKEQYKATSFLQERNADKKLLCITWMTLMSYQRFATHSNIFSKPLTPQEAWVNIEDLLRLPEVRFIAEEERFAEYYAHTTKGLHVRENLLSNAHLAAILRQHSAKIIYSADTDFRKFDFLKVINPLK